MEAESESSQPAPEMEPVEPRGERLRRRGRRTGLYAWAFVLVALLVVVVALALANTHQVELNWLFGTNDAPLVWVILAASILGWLLGIATSVVFGRRTRRRRPSP